MQHLGTKDINTERLLLRKLKTSDANMMYNNWAHDCEVTKYLTWQPHKDVKESERKINEWINNYSKNNFYLWTIQLNDGIIIGNIGVGEYIEKTDCAIIGYCIGKMWWNKGYTSEAFSAIIKFLFDEVGVNRIQASHDVNNPNSGKVMQKCGLLQEGILKQSEVSNQGIYDSVVYGLIAEDYYKKSIM